MDSILNTIKKKLGVELDYQAFDEEIITDINSVLMFLNQLGVGPTSGYSITSEADLWSDFIPGITDLEGIKTYIYLRVRLLFDPPTNAFLVDSFNKQIEEFAYRIITQVEDAGV